MKGNNYEPKLMLGKKRNYLILNMSVLFPDLRNEFKHLKLLLCNDICVGYMVRYSGIEQRKY